MLWLKRCPQYPFQTLTFWCVSQRVSCHSLYLCNPQQVLQSIPGYIPDEEKCFTALLYPLTLQLRHIPRHAARSGPRQAQNLPKFLQWLHAIPFPHTTNTTSINFLSPDRFPRHFISLSLSRREYNLPIQIPITQMVTYIPLILDMAGNHVYHCSKFALVPACNCRESWLYRRGQTQY